jgi:basic membrane lipoprotein Med (substrate-binding protein (PBP1-ABC) superfamily)
MSALLAACGATAAEPTPQPKNLKVAVLLDQSGEDDKGFNEYSLKGAREAAEEANLDLESITSVSPDDHERNVANMAAEADLVITYWFI